MAITPETRDYRTFEVRALDTGEEDKLTIRPRSCRLTTATYFVYEGQRYDVLYWQPHYKRRDRLEVMLKLVVEDA